MKLLIFIFLFLIFSNRAWSREPQSWQEVRQSLFAEREQRENRGLSLMISGGVVAVGASLGYRSSEDILSRGVLAVTSNLGLSAIAWGATVYWGQDDKDLIFKTLESSSLSLSQKEELWSRYHILKQHEEDQRRWIQVASHVLLATVNFYSATQESHPEVQSLLQVLGGVHLIWAVSLSF